MKVGDITREEVQDLIIFAENDERFRVSLLGALSQIRHKRYLQTQGYNVQESDSNNRGLPDFQVSGAFIEHKRARNKLYADGSFMLEFQKSRKSGNCKSNRFYNVDFCNIVAIDVGEHTKKTNDYRYVRVEHMERHPEFPSKLKSLHRSNDRWKKTLEEVIS